MKYQLKSFYTIDKFDHHQIVKDSVLDKIINNETTTIRPTDNSNVSISLDGLDWESSSNFSREWTQILLPPLMNQLQKIGNQYGFKDPLISDIWYQKYNKNNYHGWHHHGNTFTGVYYLEFPEGSPKTDLLCPTTNKILNADVVEGDILLFPSYLIHRAPKVESRRKTIVSWNMSWETFADYMLKNLQEN